MSERPDADKADKKPEVAPPKTGEKKPEPEKSKPTDSGSGTSGGSGQFPPDDEWKPLNPGPHLPPTGWWPQITDPPGSLYYDPENPTHEFNAETGEYFEKLPDGDILHGHEPPWDDFDPKKFDPSKFVPPKFDK